MRFLVRMLAFQPEFGHRPVNVPDAEMQKANTLQKKLNLIFHYGQNDCQPDQEFCSVSSGDVIEFPAGHSDELYLIKPVGFHRMTAAEYEDYEQTDRRDRSFYPLLRQEKEPKIVGYWVMSGSSFGKLKRWGLNGNAVFPYTSIDDAEKQMKELKAKDVTGGMWTVYLVRVFDNGQMNVDEYIP